MKAKVGSFAKSTGGAPASQAISGIGFQPNLIILFTSGGTVDGTFRASWYHSIGAASGASEVGAIGHASQDAVANHNTTQRVAAKVLTIAEWDEVLRAECDLTSFDSDGFTLSWTTNNATAYIIHYLALQVTVAKVHMWQMGTATGNKSITGVGFKPDVVMFLHVGLGLTGALPQQGSFALSGPGVMDKNGNQWGMFARSFDSSTFAGRGFSTSAAMVETFGSATFSYVSMDSDGYTINIAGPAIQNGWIVAIALRAQNFKIGSFSKSTGAQPASQAITGVGFPPVALLLAGHQHITAETEQSDIRLGIGVCTASGEEATAFSGDQSATNNSDAIDKSGKTFIKVNNNTPAIDAECDLTSMDSDGFTLNWTVNDAVATKIGFLALGADSGPGRKVRLAGRRPTTNRARGSRRYRRG